MGNWTIFIIGWIVCGILSYGINFATFTKCKYHVKDKHKPSAIFLIITGLASGIPGLILSLVIMDWWNHGLKFW